MIKTIKIDRHLVRSWLTHHGQTEIIDDVEVAIVKVPVDLEIFIASS